MQPERIPLLDFAKGYAICTIVVYHALQRVALTPVLQKAIVFGGTGVHLFFFLSGLGLALSQRRDAILDFYYRRFTKVWIPYVLALTLSLMAALVFGLFPDRFDAWLAGVCLYQMFVERYIESFGGHYWFVSAIFQFYLVFPLLIRFQDRLKRPITFIGVALALSVAWWVLVFALGKGDLRVWNSFFLQFLWEFALGMACASYIRTHIGGVRLALALRAGWKWLAAGLFFTALMIGMIFKMGAAGRIFNDIPALLGYGSLCVFVYWFSERYAPFIARFFVGVGDFSYAFYLVHILVLESYLRVLSYTDQRFSLLHIIPFVALALLAGRAFEPLSRRVQAAAVKK